MRWPALPGGHLSAHSDGEIALGLAKPICQIRRGEVGGLTATPARGGNLTADNHGGRLRRICTASGGDSSDWDVRAFKAKLRLRSGTPFLALEVSTAQKGSGKRFARHG